MLGFMAISGFFGLRNLQKLSISLKFPDEIYCGIPAQLVVRLSTKRTLLCHYLLTLRVEGSQAECLILKPKTLMEMKTPVTFKKRGSARISKAAVTSPFPVNFFVRSNLFDLDAGYLVFPKPLPLPHGWAGGARAKAGNILQRRKGSSGETESIGEYTGSEPLKQIHWKLSARHDELLVKEMSSETGKPLIIELGELPGGAEERLGHAAFLINSLMAEGRAIGLKIGEKTIPPGISRGHRLKMLEELAGYAAD